MKHILALVFAMVCSGVDFLKDPPDKADLWLLRHESMRDAWDRVRRNPFSFFHDWVNVLTSYLETPAQEPPAKLIGFIYLVTSALAFLAGAIAF